MPETRFENVLGLIDRNLIMNRDEVLQYINSHPDDVGRQLVKMGYVEIPTSAGVIKLEMDAVCA